MARGQEAEAAERAAEIEALMPIAPKSILIAILAAMTWPAISHAQTAMMTKMKDCLLIEDGYKERLDCYDAVIPREPKANAPKAKTVAECRFLKEEDQRLSCYNGFVAKTTPPAAAKKPPAKKGTSLPPVH
jgi:hypothetical protein